ncbi:rRNA maturation RNase YbeY [Oceanidesulfovibrio indonesiensis]|uniref:Endoribonuclease YbeY n=1 Tax=Oceanidesulfovibrio indonesiensis TaxID=54767 RepID=A0A7M3MFI0_9BACT|nr:rRNA maturation RNase YbeY [Oceanidesulfovibrio indonesiensis]TVM17387.1 rRNA maturation RNase YbeY [Oceanidesulfovibrio indonesiensis]
MITVEREPGVARCVGVSRSETERLVRAMLDGVGAPDANVHILLAGDREIERLNRLHLGLPGPTNVLSFPARSESGDGHGDDDVVARPCDTAPDGEDEHSLGSLAISMDAVAREGVLYGEGFERTFARHLCHGLLHLAGHDHGAVMYELTESLLDELAPFAE